MGNTCNIRPQYGAAWSTNNKGLPGGAPALFQAPHPGWPGQGRKVDEQPIPVHVEAFQLSVSSQDVDSSTARGGWRSMYALGPMLGDGVSAKVYEAEALTPGVQNTPDGLGAVVWGNCGGKPPCLTERGRRVAIKRFHRVGSRTFKKELAALQRVGVHPHVLRLLESYEGCDNEDVLVLEYCDGSTVYDLYAREHPHGGLPERLIVRLIRQLLLALEHLNNCGVEHQDVKPENMMLHDVSLSNCQAELKLGDFGWAMVVPPHGMAGATIYKPPTTGAGSLWYAPPELNPPVQGIPQDAEAVVDVHGNPLRGRSDMWSVGVVLYLLLVGHNPFNAALKQPTQDAVDAEVLRLAALGHFNRHSEKWKKLNTDTRDFILALLQVRARMRPGASEALHHPYFTRRLAKSVEASVFFHGPVSNWADRDASWAQLDGLQRLGWVAIARAVAEPELDHQAISAAMEGMRAVASEVHKHGDHANAREATYLFQLARELGTAPVGQWLQDRNAWSEVLRLAFSYLDVDGDGVLSPRDLASHLAMSPMVMETPGSPAITTNTDGWSAACRWIARWQGLQESQVSMSLSNARDNIGVELPNFRAALLASHCNDALFEAFEAPLASANGFYLNETENTSNIHPSFSRVTAGPHDHDEEEINWTDLVSRGIHSGRA